MKRRAFTLAEIMVTVGLMALLGTCIFLVILPSFRVAAEGQIRTELQQQGELALQQLNVDLQASVPTGVTLVPPASGKGMMVGINPLAKNLTTAGALAYQAELSVWWHDLNKGQLFRRTFHNGEPPSTTILPFPGNKAIQVLDTDLGAICAAKGPDQRSYALSVQTFLVQKEVTTGGEVYGLRIVLSKVIPGKNRNAVVELYRKAMLRNHS